jgi:hypothetical protein
MILPSNPSKFWFNYISNVKCINSQILNNTNIKDKKTVVLNQIDNNNSSKNRNSPLNPLLKTNESVTQTFTNNNNTVVTEAF